MIKKVLPKDGLVLFFVLLYSILNIAALFLMKDNFSILLSFPLFLLRFYTFKDTELPKDLNKFVYWNYLELSFVAIFFIRYFNGSTILDEHSISTFQIGLVILITNLGLISFFNIFLIHKKAFQSKLPELGNRILIFFAILISSTFAVATIGHYLGIGRMGVIAPFYPYKLESIINHFRNSLSPFIYLLIADYFWDKKKVRHTFIVISLFVIFTLVESVFKASRGNFFLLIIMLSTWTIYREIFPFKRILKLATPLLLAVLLLFPIITNLRSTRITGSDFSISKALKDYSFKSLFRTSLYARVFGAGEEIRKFKEKLGSDFSGVELRELFKLKGAPVYHTKIVDKIQEGVAHSSGITGLGDGYIFGGNIFLIFTSLFYTFLFSLLDRNIFSLFSHPLTKTLLTFWLYLSLFGGNGFWSTLCRSPFYIIIWPGIFLTCWLWIFYYKENKQL